MKSAITCGPIFAVAARIPPSCARSNAPPSPRRFAMNAPLQLSRRDLLKGSSALVVAFSLAPHLEAFAQGAAATKPVSLDQVDTFLAIDDKGTVMLYAGKVGRNGHEDAAADAAL